MSKNKNQQQRFKPKFRLKKGDSVVVISGEDKGVEGRILSVDTQKGKAVVEGVNFIKKHTKPTQEHPQGGIIKREAPIQLSNLMLLDPKSNTPTRVGRRVENGKIVRYAKKTGEELS